MVIFQPYPYQFLQKHISIMTGNGAASIFVIKSFPEKGERPEAICGMISR
jgi:hypothetical protein